MSTNKRTLLSLEPETRDRLEKLAAASGTTLTELVRRLVNREWTAREQAAKSAGEKLATLTQPSSDPQVAK